MRTLHLKKLKWIDILNPKKEDVEFLRKNFSFHPLILEEIKHPTFHPLLESYESYLFWITHVPNWGTNSHIVSQEVDFLMTSDALVTIRYQKFDDFEKVYEEIAKNQERYRLEITGHLFYHIVRSLLEDTFPELDKIKKEVDEIEEEIFSKLDERIIERLTGLKRDATDFLRTLKPQKYVWEAAQKKCLDFWGARFKPYFSDLFADYHRIFHIIETHKEAVDTLFGSSEALLNAKRNYVIKILTIFTAVILPLSLITSLYGMNIKYLPGSDNPFAFFIFIILMIVVSISSLIYFKWKKWL